MMETDGLKKIFWALASLALVGFFVLTVALVPAVSRFGNSYASSRTVTVTSEGKAFAVPDTAEASFSVVSQGKDPVTLTTENNKKVQAVVEALKGMGIEAKDVQTTGYSLNPNYSYDAGRTRLDGYSLNQTVTVKFRDFDKAKEALGKLPSLGVNQVGNLSMSVADEEKATTEARNDAMAKARAKAAAIAQAGGAGLGRLVLVNESGVGRPPMPYYASKEAFGMGGADAVQNAAPSVEPGTQEVRVSVTLTYELE
jgi:uncharacterized protein